MSGESNFRSLDSAVRCGELDYNKLLISATGREFLLRKDPHKAGSFGRVYDAIEVVSQDGAYTSKPDSISFVVKFMQRKKPCFLSEDRKLSDDEYNTDLPRLRSYAEHECQAIQFINPHADVTALQVNKNGKERVAVIMPKHEGMSLSVFFNRASERFALPKRAVLELAKDLLSQVHKLHQKKFVHFDIHPSNVMLTKSGLRLYDFSTGVNFMDYEEGYYGEMYHHKGYATDNVHEIHKRSSMSVTFESAAESDLYAAAKTLKPLVAMAEFDASNEFRKLIEFIDSSASVSSTNIDSMICLVNAELEKEVDPILPAFYADMLDLKLEHAKIGPSDSSLGAASPVSGSVPFFGFGGFSDGAFVFGASNSLSPREPSSFQRAEEEARPGALGKREEGLPTPAKDIERPLKRIHKGPDAGF